MVDPKKYPQLHRILAEAPADSPLDKIGAALKEVFKKHFPQCYFSFGSGALGRDPNYRLMVFRLVGDQAKLPNGISENDPAKSMWSLEMLPDGKVRAELSNGGSYSVVSKNPAFAMDRVKLGWRNKTDTPERIVPYFDAFLGKAKKIMQQSVDQSYGTPEQVEIYREHLK